MIFNHFLAYLLCITEIFRNKLFCNGRDKITNS